MCNNLQTSPLSQKKKKRIRNFFAVGARLKFCRVIWPLPECAHHYHTLLNLPLIERNTPEMEQNIHAVLDQLLPKLLKKF